MVNIYTCHPAVDSGPRSVEQRGVQSHPYINSINTSITCSTRPSCGLLAAVDLLWYLKNMVDFQRISLRVDRKDISYVHYIVEGYDGLGSISTQDPSRGLLWLTYPETCRNDIEKLIRALQAEDAIKEVIES